MQVSAILLARYLGFVETFDLNPVGKVFFPDLIPALVERYKFQSFPTKFDELDEQKGVEFLEGKWDGVTVDRLTIYRNGIMMDTRSSTADSEKLLEDVLLWAAKEFQVAYRPGMIKRKAYVSQLTFHSDVPILGGLNSALSRLSVRVGRATNEITGDDLVFEPFTVTLHHDRISLRQPVAAFTIQRRLETPFSENKYFSEAPLPTDLHLTLLQEFENDLVGTIPKAVTS